MTEENDQSIEVELMSDEILGNSITLKGTEDQGRVDGKLGSRWAGVHRGFPGRAHDAWCHHQDERVCGWVRAGWINVGRGKLLRTRSDYVLCL